MEFYLKNINGKLLLAILFLLFAAPGAFADRGRCDDHGRHDKCRQVPEGGSAIVYLMGAGITCLGAMVVRARTGKPSLS